MATKAKASARKAPSRGAVTVIENIAAPRSPTRARRTAQPSRFTRTVRAIGSARSRATSMVEQVTTAAGPTLGGGFGGVAGAIVRDILPDRWSPMAKSLATVALGVGAGVVARVPKSVVSGVAGAAGCDWYRSQRSRRATDK